ncbi:hypothetical protein BAU15_05410 [Enterococcus sp. JM4C]|uniref:phage baseplate upper protein n=1 Tax=Candidatus Enterococcus huntleyi TaxID=1857217 RepID=UPI00137B8604|nr:BppU family phage baseplate upper protein [Enterococcus sp. JM4C]KAF1295190.1 hypothetical protein BAU15_05410 [Enterococcus sp. JM4C]
MAIRYPITLSTTEPNNNIGLIKIRQADEETQTLVVEITENAIPKSYEGLQVFFCAKLGQTEGIGLIEQKLNTNEMKDPKKGLLEYTMRPEDWQELGRQVGYFSFRKMKDDHEWVEQFSTRDFYFHITKSVFSDGVKEVKKDGSTYVWTIEDLIRLFNEYIASGKTDWEDFVEQNKDIIESVDPGGELLSRLGLFNRFRAWDFSVIEKMENEFAEREFNVKWFGAKGGLVEDDTDAIQAAIDKAAENGGGIVLLPLESYRITHALRMKDNVVLKGQGSQMWETNAQRTKIVLDSTNINETAIDFRGKLLETNDYPDKIIYDLTKIKHTFGAALVDLHITNIPENRNSAGVMFNCCPTCFLQNVSIDGTFEVALVSAMSWFTSFKRVYAKGIFVGAFMQGMNASNIDMLLVGGRNQTEVANNMSLNVSGKDKIDKSVGLFYRNSPGNTFNSLTAEFSYNGLMFYETGSVIINGLYLENLINRGLEVRSITQVTVDGGHVAAVPKLYKITDRSSVTASSIDVATNDKYIETIDDYSNLLCINEKFPRYSHTRLKYIGHFVNNVIAVDSVNGDDGNSGIMYNAEILYPVKTLEKAFAICEASENSDFTIYLQSASTYSLANYATTLTKKYTLRKRGYGNNPVIWRGGASAKSIKMEDGAVSLINVNILDESTGNAITEVGVFSCSGKSTLGFQNCNINVGVNGVIQPGYNRGAIIELCFATCTLSGSWLVARQATGLGKAVVIETSSSTTLPSSMATNGIPSTVNFLASTLFNK